MPIIHQDEYNAFLNITGPEIPAGNGPLEGRTLAVKDIYDVAGYPTGCGNPHKLAESQPAPATAPSVQVLIDAGAEFVGKTQTDELAFSLNGHNAHWPRPINPAAPDRVSGGSSSGSATAVRAGLAGIGIGSDTGGSIRAPASYGGLVGLRSTHGAISLEGAMKLAPSFDVFGWFASDMALYGNVAALLLPDTAFDLSRSMRLPEQEALLLGDPEQAVFEQSLSLVEAVLGDARPVTLSTTSEERYWCLRKIQAYEAWKEHGEWIRAADRQLGPGVRERFEFGSTISAEALQAESIIRESIERDVTSLIGEDGVFVMPTVPGAAPLAANPFEKLQEYRERAVTMLSLSGLTGLPELTLPLGTVDNAPFGLSLLGPRGSDRALLTLGDRILSAHRDREG